eukprot:gene31174-38521_t
MFHFTSEYTPVFTRNISEPDLEYLSNIAPLSSHGMLVIKHRLLVKLDLRDNGNEDRQDIWFKDEGGKDNCIDVHVRLVDQNGNLVTTRSVPLRLTLQYASGENVLKQDLLVVMPDSSMSVEKSGCALIKLRINDVSKNHQRQQFHITVSPDTGAAPLLNDVSADESHNIEVKSKRTKRTRDSLSGGVGAQMFAAPIATQYANSSNGSNNRLSQGQQQLYAPPSTHHSGGRSHSSSTASQQQHQAALMDDSLLLMNNGVGGGGHSLRNSSNGSASGGGSGVKNNVSFKGSIDSSSNISHNVTPKNDQHHTSSSPSEVVDAIVLWTASLTYRLQSVRWQQIGYEQTADGSVDTTRPLHSMRNPNEIIDEILKEIGAGSALSNNLSSLAVTSNNSNISGSTSYDSGLSISTDLIDGENFYNGAKLRSNSNASEHEWASLIQNVEEGNASLEMRVHYIVALPYKTIDNNANNSNNTNNSSSSSSADNVELGFPAYSAEENLLGFYQEKQDDRNHATVITFIPLSASVVTLTTQQMEAADNLLHSQLSVNSAAVYSMVKCGGDLESMKQDAMVHYWLSEVSLEDEF